MSYGTDAAIATIPAGTAYRPDEIVFYSGKDERSLDDALAEADLLVSCPHSGSALPAELARFLVPEYNRRMQFDFTDMTTSAIVRRWAEIDARIVYVENPHPRLVRDPNRSRPDDLEATLRDAFARVAATGYGHKMDLSGVDAIRPVTFAFEAVLRPVRDDTDLRELVAAFELAGSRGLDVYQSTRVNLLEQMVEQTFARAAATGRPQRLTTLSFHDTMNHTMGPGGAINIERALADRLPDVAALSNRGDISGEQVGDRAVTMDAARIRALAEAHRVGFSADEGAVALNTPYLGSEEIITAGKRFDELRPHADAASVALDAVQAEFRREFLLGPEATARLMAPGTDWPSLDPARVDLVAQGCKASWDLYRAQGLPS